jgi:hypothetical protein
MSVAIDRRPAGKYEVLIPEEDYVLLGKIAKRLGRHANAPALFTQLAERYLTTYFELHEKGALPELFVNAPPLSGPFVASSIRVANDIKVQIDKITANHGEDWDFNRSMISVAHLGLKDLLTGPLAGKAF